MGLQWRFELTIMVDEAKKIAFKQKLIQYLTTAKTNGEIISAIGTATPTEVPEAISVT
ncbi:hypothetical protein ES702_07620 [subsurface metagenome]